MYSYARFGAAEDLTCKTTAHKKRSREEPEVSHQHTTDPFLLNKQQQQQNWLYGSHDTSTNGGTSAAPAVDVPVEQQSLEIDTVVLLHSNRMRLELELVLKRHRRDLISVIRQHVVKMINEKDEELERARQRTVELEQKVRETASECCIWLNVAKNNEAVACNLRSVVEQALLQNDALAEHRNCSSPQLHVNDAESCCYEGLEWEPAVRPDSEELRQPAECTVCGDVCTVSCRHLSLCRDCEPSYDACRVCHTT